MKKYIVLSMVVVSVFGATSFAQAAHPPGWECPLKNFKKNQRRGPDGTAFIPGKNVKKPGVSDSGSGVFINK